MVQNPDEYFDANQVPDGFTLLDPSKMKDPQINELLNFWHSQQQDNDDGVAFRFHSKGEGSGPMSSMEKKPDSPDPSVRRSKDGKGKQKASESWLDPITPDSRRRKRRRSLSTETSGEEFDFRGLDDMTENDEDVGPRPGGSKKQRIQPPPVPPAGKVVRFESNDEGSGKCYVLVCL